MNMNAISPCRRRSGFVLLSVLLLGTVLLSAATALTWFARSVARSVAGKRNTLEERTFAHVVVRSAAVMLGELGEHVTYDAPGQQWYQPVAVDRNGESCVLKITPLDDKIPVRSLFLPDGNTLRTEFADVWTDMWEALNKPGLADVVLDMMDKNDKPRVGSLEVKGWLNRPLYDMGELLFLSKDITPETLDRLNTYVTLWSDGRINLNTAPQNVLVLLPGLDTGNVAERLISWRNEHPLGSVSDIDNIPGVSGKASSRLQNIGAVKSRYISMTLDTPTTQFHAIVDRTTRTIMKWEEE